MTIDGDRGHLDLEEDQYRQSMRACSPSKFGEIRLIIITIWNELPPCDQILLFYVKQLRPIVIVIAINDDDVPRY